MKKTIKVFSLLAAAFLCFAQGCSPDGGLSSDSEKGGEMEIYDPYKPVWEGDTVYNETVVLMENEDGTYSGRLLFAPSEILSVKNYTLEKEFDLKRFETDGNTIFCTDIEGDEATIADDVPFMTEAMAAGDEGNDEFGWDKYPGSDILFTEGIGVVLHQIAVTYKHTEEWTVKSEYQGDILENFQSKLSQKQNIEMFLFGDSITSGCNSSEHLHVEPYLPRWGNAVASLIEERYDVFVNMINGSKVGGTSQDGLGDIENQLNLNYTLKNRAPDIAFIGYGMNDGSAHVSASKYKQNVQNIIDAIREKFPECDIVLLSTMLANSLAPQYTVETPTYLAKVKELCEENERAVYVDMTTFSEEIYKTKKGLDVLANNINHPSDFLVRAYIWNIMAVLFN